MAGSEFDDAVQKFVREYGVPKRRREARIADRLSTVEPDVVDTRWGALSAWRLGSGPAVLLVHGWEDDNSLWSPLIEELHQRGRALVAFDLPGHGASGGDWGVGFEGSDGVAAVADASGPIDAVVAHSFGCGVVQSRDDERNSVSDTQEVIPRNPRARLVLVDDLTHRRTARDPGVIRLVADFVAG